MTNKQELVNEITRLVRETHGDGYTDEFYEAEAAEFIEWAEWYAQAEFIRRTRPDQCDCEDLGMECIACSNHRLKNQETVDCCGRDQ